MGKPRKKYTEEFKRDAVRMMRSRLVISVSVVLRRFGVVVRSLRVMMGCLGVMMRCLL